jgi:hypothetical protein
VSDLVCTVPKPLWAEWILEGDAAGDPPTGIEWAFCLGGGRPPISRGERLYIVSWGRLRGYSPVTRTVRTERGWAICREAGAVACTIEAPVLGFRGWQRRWWPPAAERPFPDWMTSGVPESMARVLKGEGVI